MSLPSDRAAVLYGVIRTVPDFPSPGVMFRDITPLLADADALHLACDAFIDRHRHDAIDKVGAVDARGFIFGGIVAHALHAGFVPVRKAGKLPSRRRSETYALEYGSGTLEIHEDAVVAGQRVLLVDDLIATGGTLLAAARLVQQLGATVVSCAAVIDLPDLGGSQRLRAAGFDVFTLIEFSGH
jgi:adenine phosphoribosyltransferase